MHIKRILNVLVVALVFVSCKDRSTGKKFEVNGTITNAPEKIIYLEEINMMSMQRIRVDSAILKENGKYVLKTDEKEPCAYTIRIGNNGGPPLAAIINDASPVTVNAAFIKGNDYTVTYEVTGSKASTQLKDFMVGLNTKLQAVYFNDLKADSLVKAGAPDSTLYAIQEANVQIAAEAKNFLMTSLQQAENPALTMFELGNYQGMANNPVFKLHPVNNEELAAIVNRAAEKFPTHNSLAAIKQLLDAQLNKIDAGWKWAGKQAPEISLPDVNGKMVTLSSYRGKYVLVDFWASWCGPCRTENPTVVAAYNKFKGKNFDILGVSFDNPGEKSKWLEAIRKDNLGWTQVSDLQGWASTVASVYNFKPEGGIPGIPYNVLVDPQGMIIAEGLRGSELEMKLAEVLK